MINDSYRYAYPNVTNFADHKKTWNAMASWIIENVADFEVNAVCFKRGDCIYIELSDAKDAVAFVLTFGKGNKYEPV